jgi:hypothetical protein
VNPNEVENDEVAHKLVLQKDNLEECGHPKDPRPNSLT